MFFGDSITQAGARKGGYIRVAEATLKRVQPERKIQFIGAGISGNKVTNLQKRLQKDVLQKKPTQVMIYIGINDVWHWSHPRAEEKGLKGTTPEDYEAGLKELIKGIKEAGATVLLCTPTVIGEKHDGTNPDDEKLDEYAGIVRTVAAETGCALLDLRKAFIDYLKEHNPENLKKGILTHDTVHLNKTGNEFIAHQVLQALRVPVPDFMAESAREKE